MLLEVQAGAAAEERDRGCRGAPPGRILQPLLQLRGRARREELGACSPSGARPPTDCAASGSVSAGARTTQGHRASPGAAVSFITCAISRYSPSSATAATILRRASRAASGPGASPSWLATASSGGMIWDRCACMATPARGRPTCQVRSTAARATLWRACATACKDGPATGAHLRPPRASPGRAARWPAAAGAAGAAPCSSACPAARPG